MNRPETQYERLYVDLFGKETHRRRDAVHTRFTFFRVHEDGHRYETKLDSKTFTVAPPMPIQIKAEALLDTMRYDYDTNGDHSECTHPWKKLRHSPEEYGGSTCTICGTYLQGTGR